MRICLSGLGILLFSFVGTAQQTSISFDVLMKGKDIGDVIATEQKTNTRSIKDIKTNCDNKVLMVSVHVESELTTTHENGSLIKGTAYRHANRGSSDVHAETIRTAPKQYRIERNGTKTSIANQEIQFCVADLYFKEPKGLSSIFSNMWGANVTVAALGGGKYKITNPDGKSSTYTYQNGSLIQMEVDTPIGTVITKRK
ncbi:MAG: DUF6134 family protein [Chitinophagaceae bacterium]|jgi:hypothetical protein